MFLIPPVAQFSRSVVSDSLGPHGLQHARLSCPSLLELAQTHVHCIRDATQLSHPLLSPFPPSIFPSIRSFQLVSSLHQAAKLLKLQHQFSW